MCQHSHRCVHTNTRLNTLNPRLAHQHGLRYTHKPTDNNIPINTHDTKNNCQYLLSVFYEPGTVLSTLIPWQKSVRMGVISSPHFMEK